MRRLMTTALTLASVSLALTACGGESSDDGNEVAVAALGSVLAQDLPPEQAHCAAEKIVTKVGTGKLTDAGVLTEQKIAQLKNGYDKTLATQIADGIVACWDWRENTKSWASAYPAADPEEWDKYVACAEKLDNKLHAALVASKVKGGTSQPRDAFTKAQLKCRKVLGQPIG